MKLTKLSRFLTPLVLLAILAGALLGHLAPATAVRMNALGTGFIAVVKLFINPIIFLTITLGISTMGDLKKVGRIGGKAILYFEIVTTLALLIGVGAAALVRPGAGVAMKAAPNAGAVSEYTQRASQFSWTHFLADNLTLQVLLASIALGIFLSRYAGRQAIIHYLKLASKAVFQGLHLVMLFAPIGAFGGMAFTIGKYGIATLLPLGKLMLTVYLAMGVFVFGVLGVILRSCGVGMWAFLKYIRQELLIVLGTSSSEAGLPGLMEKLERLGCAPSVVGLVVPTGYSFNLDGTAIYLTMASIFIADALGKPLAIGEQVGLLLFMMVASKGAAGVSGAGLATLAGGLQSHRPELLDGVGLIVGIDRFMSEARAITNFSGNAIATLLIGTWTKTIDAERVRETLDGQHPFDESMTGVDPHDADAPEPAKSR